MNRKAYNGMLLDVASVAVLLGTTERAVRARVARRLLPHRRLGSRVLFVKDEIEQFVQGLPGATLQQAQDNLAQRSGVNA
jgi:excisionase family DNA binding protein